MNKFGVLAPKNKNLKMTPAFSHSYVKKSLYDMCGEQIQFEVRIPDAVIDSIVDSGNSAKINEVGKGIRYLSEVNQFALGFLFVHIEKNKKLAKMFVEMPKEFMEIAKAAGDKAWLAFGSVERVEVRKLFVKHPDKFVEIAKAAGDKAWLAFDSVERVEVRKLFVKHPDKFVEIANAAGKNTSAAFEALASVGVGKLFVKHPDKFVEIAKAAGDEAWLAFGSVERVEVRKLFVKHLDKFVEIAKAAGENTGAAFKALASVGVGKLFVKHPDKFVEIAKAVGENTSAAFEALARTKEMSRLFLKEPEGVSKVFSQIASICGRRSPHMFGILNTLSCSRAFTKNPEAFITIAELSAYSPVLNRIEKNKYELRSDILENVDYPEKIVRDIEGWMRWKQPTLLKYKDEWKKGQKFAASIGAHSNDREICINFAYALDVLGKKKTKALYQRLGIEYFARYSKEHLEEMYWENQTTNTQPLLVIANNKNDPNYSFYQDIDNIDSLREYYNIVVVEVETEGELYKQLSEVVERYGRIETLVIGGHGNPTSINLGIGWQDEYNLDLTDRKEMKKHMAFFTENPTIILASCSTGKTEKAIGAVLSSIWNATVFAPKVPTSIKEYVVDKDTERISGVVYRKDSTIFNRKRKKRKK